MHAEVSGEVAAFGRALVLTPLLPPASDLHITLSVVPMDNTGTCARSRNSGAACDYSPPTGAPWAGTPTRVWAPGSPLKP